MYLQVLLPSCLILFYSNDKFTVKVDKFFIFFFNESTGLVQNNHIVDSVIYVWCC